MVETSGGCFGCVQVVVRDVRDVRDANDLDWNGLQRSYLPSG
jgi:hypothetical protein